MDLKKCKGDRVIHIKSLLLQLLFVVIRTSDISGGLLPSFQAEAASPHTLRHSTPQFSQLSPAERSNHVTCRRGTHQTMLVGRR